MIEVIRTIIPVIVMLVIGIFCRQRDMISREGIGALKNVVVNITLPAVLLKTAERRRSAAEADLERSLRLLKTDCFDVYQLHGVSSMEEVEIAFGPGGVMEMMRTLKERGITRYIGFTAHSEEAALRMIELYPFDTVLFPINWFMHMKHGFGDRLLKVAKEKGMGRMAIKALIERKWKDGEDRGPFPKSWCKPINTDLEPEFGVAAMNYTMSLGVDTLIPPGNFNSFRFAVEHIDTCDRKPDMTLLREKLETVCGMEFL